jgi:hypothetical protein
LFNIEGIKGKKRALLKILPNLQKSSTDRKRIGSIPASEFKRALFSPK